MPADTRPAGPRPLSALRGLLPFLRPYRVRVALAFVLLCLGSAAILVVPLALALGLAWLVLTIMAGMKANNGESYRYPFALRLIK